MTDTGTTRAARVLLPLVPLTFLVVFFVWPVGAILGRGLWRHGSLDLAAFTDTLRRPDLVQVLRFTVWQATLSTALTLTVGLPLTAVVSRVQFPGRALVHALVIVPFVLPTIVVATAFRSLGVERSLGAILLAHCFFNLAVVVRVVGATWETLDRRTTDAARTLGAGPLRTFWSVTLPSLRSALVAAGSIVFLFCFTSFGVILVLGGPTFGTLETEIYRQTAELLDLRTAAVLSILQLATVVVALVLAGAMAGRAGRRRVGRPDRVRLRTPRARLLAGIAVLPGLALVVVPVFELVRRSFADGALGWSRLDQVTTGFSASPLHAVTTSLTIALAATAISVTLGLALATAVTRRRRSRLGRVGELAVVLPLGVSAVTVGFGFLIVFDTPPLDLRTSWWIVPIAHALIALPFVVRTAVPLLRDIDPHQREAAALLGASPRRVWREVDLRVIARAAAVAAGFAFAISLGEFGATLFIVRPETTTVPIAIYRYLGRPGATNGALAFTLATILMVVTALAALAADRVHSRAGRILMLAVDGVGVRYGTTVAVEAVSLEVPDGAIVAVLGPSGSGKTSLLRAVAGLEPVTAGRVRWDGEDVTDLAPHRRGFGLMFQDHALFDHHDVAGNVAFGLRMQGVDRAARAARVAAMLDLVGLAGTGTRRVDQLSGGEQQRVALARALAPGPRLLMLDEPLASVDRERREALARSLHVAIRRTRTATLLVTHDLDEAFTLADSVVILDHGVVLQTGPATDVWRAPASRAVARFLGVTTELSAHVEHGTIATPWGPLAAPADIPTGPVVVGLRPTDVVVDPAGGLAGTVRTTWFRRDHFLVELDTAYGPMTAIAAVSLVLGTAVATRARLESAVILDA